MIRLVNRNYSVSVLNADGSLIKKQQITSSDTHNMNIGSLQPGIYFFQVKSGNILYTKHFIKINPN
jgi:Secretion system C-terminal sorting domain